MKTISFVIPCYNAAGYMEHCLSSVLSCGEDIEIIIVNDGSTDNTSAIAHEWEVRFPNIVKVIDQDNAGHGGAVNTGIAQAGGLYVKVVDSDDWLDEDAMRPIMAYLRSQVHKTQACDMVVANYIYDKVHEGSKQTISYRNVFPTNRTFTWDEIGKFGISQYLLMHSVIYKRSILTENNITLPEHCFYVDNIFVYAPLPYVASLYYLDVDMYHYFIGRDDQSVNEQVMLSRIDQQLHITKVMIDEVDLSTLANKNLAAYMYNYLSMMMCICSVFLRMEPTRENEAKRAHIWAYLQEKRPGMYAKIRANTLNLGSNLPSPLGRALALSAYRIARKIFKFN